MILETEQNGPSIIVVNLAMSSMSILMIVPSILFMMVATMVIMVVESMMLAMMTTAISIVVLQQINTLTGSVKLTA